MIKRLKELKAKHVGIYHFKRIEFMLGGKAGSGHSWARVRTDGKRTTITLKEMKKEGGFTPMEEYEVETKDFINTVKIMSKIAKRKLIYFENERDAYMLGDVYITIDKWQEIPAFVEMEAPSIKTLKDTYKRLKIKGKFVGNASIDNIYKNYNLDFGKVVGENEYKLRKLLGT